jgi:hypothetical protein
MSSKRLRKARYSIDRPAKVHDRTTAILPMDAHIVVDTVDDAYGIAEFATYDDERQELVSQGRPKVTVVRSIRSDPLAALKAQGAIDEVQFLAGQMWSWAHMRSEIGGVRAIDPTKERVDGGRIAEPLTDVVKRALGDLRRARPALGEDGTALVADVIGKGLTLAKAADARGLSSKSGREYLGRRFRECLDRLAVVFGCATEGRNGGQRASQIAPLSPTEPQVFRSTK